MHVTNIIKCAYTILNIYLPDSGWGRYFITMPVELPEICNWPYLNNRDKQNIAGGTKESVNET